ncbi:MAG: caspase family protein [Holophagaceae bacterium]|uniref:Caspase family protein n=1 Tax=Candidatus Geothrix skivensis TaxID=2954439 RepID=A0A9D7SJL0_9BACT|nr:caspase family protein [Candidatus Geothrix skivensis]
MAFPESKARLLRFGRCAGMFLGLLAAVALDGQELLTSTVPVRSLEGAVALQRVALSQDGMMALLLQQDNALRVVDLATGRILRVFAPRPEPIKALAIEGRAGLVWVATEREVWSVMAEGEAAPRKVWGSAASIQDLSLSPDLDLLAVATASGALILNPKTGTVLWSTTGPACSSIRFAPVGRTLALAVGRTVRIHEVPGFVLRQTWNLDDPASAIAYAPDARSLAVGGVNGSLLLKRLSDGHTLKQLDAGFAGRAVTLTDFAGDASGLFAVSGRQLQAFSGLDQGVPTSRLLALDEAILSIAFSKGAGALLAVTEGGKALARWSIATARRPSPRQREDLPSLSILSPETGSRVTTGTVDLAFQVAFRPENPVTGFRILSGGRAARFEFSPTAGAPARTYDGAFLGSLHDGLRYTCRVRLPEQDTTLLVQADSVAGSSEPVLLTLQKGAGAPPKVVPPVVTLVSPAGRTTLQSEQLILSFKVTFAPGQPVTLVRATLDGVPVPLRKLTRSNGVSFDSALGWLNGETYHCPIQVPEWDCTLALVAETAYASSSPVESKLVWKSATAVGSISPSVSGASKAVPTPAAGTVGTDFGQVKATADQSSRILEGGPQGSAMAMEVDAKGRLRWRDPAAKAAKKTPPRAAGPQGAPAPKGTASAPPSLKILEPTEGSRFKNRELQLTVRVGDGPGQEVTGLKAFVNSIATDLALQSEAGAPIGPPYSKGQTLRVLLTLPPKDCQVSIQAESAAGQGRPAVLKLKYDGDASAVGRSVLQAVKPRIAIIDPQQNTLVRSNVVQVGVRVTLDPRHPPPAIRLLVDAQEVKAERVAPAGAAPAPAVTGTRGPTEEVQYYRLTLPSKDCTVMAYAETPYATSDPSLVKLRWESPAKAAAAATGLPTLYLLAVGVSKYKDKNIALTYPSKDARDFAEVMRLQKGRMYKDVVVKILTDETATRDNVMDNLEWIQRQATQRDMVIVFFAGHGINDTVTGNYYYLPFDASIEAVKRTMIPGSEIHSTLARLTGTRLLFLDTCHAGNVTGTAMRGVPDMRQFLQELKDGGQGLVVITSSRPGQKSQEHPAWNNGAFTKALVEGLKGKALKDSQGFITFTALDAYITQRVKELTKGTQAPATQKSTEVSDFPLAFADH